MTIIVCPLSKAPQLAREHKASHVVSLLDPATTFPALAAQGHEHLCIAIHDIEAEAEGLDACCDRRMGAILDFVGRWKRDEAPILIHCYAGISRSTATAYITACAHNASADEEEIALALRAASATASPNRRLIALADAALGRGGRMSRAIDAIGRGGNWYEIGEAQPFSMPSRFGA